MNLTVEINHSSTRTSYMYRSECADETTNYQNSNKELAVKQEPHIVVSDLLSSTTNEISI